MSLPSHRQRRIRALVPVQAEVLRNNWREASAVADAQEVDAIGIDKLVVFKGAKGRAIAGKLGIDKVIYRTISFAIANALFIDAEKAEPG